MAESETADKLPVLKSPAPTSGMHSSSVPEDATAQQGAQLPCVPGGTVQRNSTTSADTDERRAEHAAPADELLSDAARDGDAAGLSSGRASGKPEDKHAQSSAADAQQPEALRLKLPAAARGSEHLASPASAAGSPGEEPANSSSTTAAGQQREAVQKELLAPLNQPVGQPASASGLEDRIADGEAVGPTEAMTGSLSPATEAMTGGMSPSTEEEAATAAAADDEDDGFGGSDDGFGDFEEAGSFAGADDTPGSSGLPVPSLPASPSEGFGAFEEVAEPADRTAPNEGPHQPSSGGGAASLTELFLANKVEYRSMVQKMLLPPEQHLPFESSTDVDALQGHITLDGILQQLAASPDQHGSSKATALLARQALDMGTKQAGSLRHTTPVAWEGTPAQTRFLARLQLSEPLPDMEREQAAHSADTPASDQPAEVQGEQQQVRGADIFAASGAVLDGEYISRDTGALRTSPTEDAAAPSSNGGTHAGGEAWGAADERFPSGYAPNGGEAAAREPDPASREPDSAARAQGSAARAHLIRRSSLKASSGMERRGSGGSPSRLSRSSFSMEENGGPAVHAAGSIALPDLSFMLADTLVLPQQQKAGGPE